MRGTGRDTPMGLGTRVNRVARVTGVLIRQNAAT
jgi:hypothetical protein